VGLLEKLIDVGRKGEPPVAEIERSIGNGAWKGSMDRITVYGRFAVSSGQDRARATRYLAYLTTDCTLRVSEKCRPGQVLTELWITRLKIEDQLAQFTRRKGKIS
jgi:hypothetical protein